ncbi:two-component system response regulator YesN [Paenibacillus endophyticus]|uniref:Two-component system response regulator YesN n=1 Tax=Paenibacillus endophyticus TaxID=1294268 RepID=A0A7W5GDX4_9BACL|nr:helix-turn-helix domain-containing protein [Paenibacillus endophyticus]MBB3155547.1 two-component system response regulator YesN [Paenibacillus endophyticus]
MSAVSIIMPTAEVAEDIRRELTEKHDLSELQRMWSIRLPQLREDFLRGWVTNRYADWELRRNSAELRMELPEHATYAVAVCVIDPLSEDETRFAAADLPLLQFSLESISNEALPPEEATVFNDANGSLVLLFVNREEESVSDLTNRVNVRLTRLLNIVKECLKLTASAGLGSAGDFASVPRSYQQACQALQERAVYGNGIAIPHLETSRNGGAILLDTDFERQLEIAVHTGEREKADALIDGYAEKAYASADSSELIYEHLLYLSGVFTRMIQTQGWSVQRVLKNDYRHFLALDTLVSKDQIVQWAKRVNLNIAAYMANEKKRSSHKLVKLIVETVDRNLESDLTLHTLAERMYVNSSYLSRLFKRETGEAYTSYVLARRMEKAKQLLLADAKVYDASAAVGYQDISYFAKVFRKFWGVAPSELKK